MVKLGAKELRKLVSGRTVSVGRESVSFVAALPEDKKELEGLRDEIESILADGPEEASNPGDEEVDEELEDEDFEDEDGDLDEEDEDLDEEDEEDDDDFEFEE